MTLVTMNCDNFEEDENGEISGDIFMGLPSSWPLITLEAGAQKCIFLMEIVRFIIIDLIFNECDIYPQNASYISVFGFCI